MMVKCWCSFFMLQRSARNDSRHMLRARPVSLELVEILQLAIQSKLVSCSLYKGTKCIERQVSSGGG